MNKPDWKEAPDWAKWLVKDYQDVYWWCEEEPSIFQYKGNQQNAYIIEYGINLRGKRERCIGQRGWYEPREETPEDRVENRP